MAATPETAGEAGAATVVSLICGKLGIHLPDFVEPSLNDPRHRRFFHSWTFLLATSAGAFWAVGSLWNTANEFEDEALATGNPQVRAEKERAAFICRLIAGGTAAAAVGIVLHLLSDAATKRGLPLI